MKTDNITPLKNPVFVTRSSMPSFKEYCDEIKGIWESHHLTNMGPKHNRLVQKLSEYLNIPSVSLYANGHLALENMLEAYKVSGEVITTPFTFVSTTNALVRKGLKPVFCDIKKDDYTIDPSKIEALITEKTSAILAVHVYGHVCDDQAISDIAQKYDLKVFYDAAHAFGVLKKGVSVAALGDCSMFSFHATKVFNTIEGGALCCRESSMLGAFDAFKNFGLDADKEYSEMGGNAKMSEFHAAMGLCNLRHLDEEIEKRKKVFERYADGLGNTEGIKLCFPGEGITHNYAYMPVLFTGAFNRDKVFDSLQKLNIFARKYFYPLTSDTEWYKINVPERKHTPIAAFVADNILCLPMYSELSSDEIDIIINAVLRSAE